MNMDQSVAITDDITILSTDPNDIGTCPTLFDALTSRAAAMHAYDIAKDTDQSVSDVPLLTMAALPAKAAMIMGSDHHGTTYVVGMVRICT